MAQEAFENTKKEMDLAAEMRLARLITNDAQKLKDRVPVEGVRAYLRQPVHRAPPNGRFLRNTIRSVEFANQQSDVEEMWRMRQKQLEQERQTRKNARRIEAGDYNWSIEESAEVQDHPHSKRAFSGKYRRGASTPERLVNNTDKAKKRKRNVAESHRGRSAESHEKEMQDHDMRREKKSKSLEHWQRNPNMDCMSSEDKEDELKEFLTSKHVRGRGGVGSRQAESSMEYFPGSISGGLLEKEDSYAYRDNDDFPPARSPGAQNEEKIRGGKKKKKSKKTKKEVKRKGGAERKKKSKREKRKTK